MPEITLSVPTPEGEVQLQAAPGRPLFLLGRNGTGKSALVHSFLAQLGEQAIYLPGSRPSYFDNESLSLTPSSRKSLTANLRSWDSSPDTRWKSISGTARNEKAIHDLTAAEAQFKIDAANQIALEGKESSAILRLQSSESPLDQVNALLEQANLPVKGVIENGELRVGRDGETYSIAKMSDGERTALILIAEVVSAAEGSFFLIDEPELHLHRAIVVPLINALVQVKPESAFLVSTHELELPAECPHSRVVIVRSRRWQGGVIASWEVDVISASDQIPDDVRVDILGSRRKILFVEGVTGSLDRPLYSLLFPNASVRPKENCREVERAVVGLRGTEAIHHAQAFGMVDGDGMEKAQISQLETKGVYPLPVHAVESLYYSAEILTALAGRQGETLGVDPEQLITEAKSAGLATLDIDDRRFHLASRVAERQLRDALLQHLPDRIAMISGGDAPVSVSLLSPYPTELARLEGLRADNDIFSIISRYPVRESGLLDALAKGLRFKGRADYERAALARVGADAALRDALRAKLGALASLLG